ncbi:TPA: GNAT family N-acetyltransferase [Streptococcus suis]|nr:GNAT family N-acetyltransferase [Streptococcus suis]HEM6265134.1 GNAT family N-acetyltransferase [Streptococcus suis]HEM6319382.1 GNAT family N-acetyltransferase [Streptococcus suis]
MFDTFPTLQVDSFQLRKIEETDLDDLWEIYSNPIHFQMTPNTLTQNKETLRKRIGHFQRDFDKKKRLFLGLEHQGKLIGVLEVFDYKKRSASVTIGYRINHAFWNQGLASQAVSLLCHFLLEACPIKTIAAFVLPENQASQQVLLKNDFQQVGQVEEGWKGLGQVSLLQFERKQ